MSQPAIIVITIAVYFLLLIVISYFASRKADNQSFFTGGRRTSWVLVTFATIGAAISGVTFISVPGMVAGKGYSYLQMALGFIVGYAAIAFVLVPLFYRKNLISIYGYLEERFGTGTYKSGAWLFFVSKMLGAAVRFFVVCAVLQMLVFGPLHIPFVFNVVVTIALIWLYTFRGGVQTVIWTDTLKSFCLVMSVVLCIYFVSRNLGFSFGDMFEAVKSHDSSRIFYFDDPKSGLYFWKQFLAGVFMVIAMTGLDQDMMQRTLACKDHKQAQKNLMVTTVIQFFVIALFLVLGTLLVIFLDKMGIDHPAKTDDIFGIVATHDSMPVIVGVLFIVGLVGAAYSAVGSALTSLTTSFTVDILQSHKKQAPEQLTRTRKVVHFAMSALMGIVIIVFYYISEEDAISAVYTLASYTYGPILGLFAFGMFSRRQVRDGLVPLVCLLAPVLSWCVQKALSEFCDYQTSFELLLINAALTVCGLWTVSRKPAMQAGKAGVVAILIMIVAISCNAQGTGTDVVLLENRNSAIPIGNLAKSTIAVVNLGDPADNAFADMCRRYAAADAYGLAGGELDLSTLEEIRRHDVVLVGVYNDSPATLDQLKQLPATAMVLFLAPDKAAKCLDAASNSQAVMLAEGSPKQAQQAAAQALFGGQPIDGRLSVPIGKYSAGAGLSVAKSRLGYTSPQAEGMAEWLPDSIDALVDAAMDMGAMPGCQVLVARNGNVVYEKAFGDITAGGPAVDLATVYDLASVSKTVGTLPGIMKAYDMGLFDLDRPAADHIPGLKEAGKTFTPRQMLYHETAMPPALSMFSLMLQDEELRTDITSLDSCDRFPWEATRGIWVGPETADTIMTAIYSQKLRPTTDYCYSCLNFCLLLDMEQRLTGQPHQQWVADSIFGPLGMYNTFYRPSRHCPLDHIAPTELDSVMRHQLVHGFVHDETAAMLGGVSGNAGLFANAGDVAKLCQALLQGGQYGDARILSDTTVNLFMTAKSPSSRRGLGFDKPDPDPDNSPTCPEASLSVVGHTGFTGTIYWIDPDQKLIYIFLTNRVNPSRINRAFARSGIRSGIFSQVYRSLQ